MRSRNNNFKIEGLAQNVLRGAGFTSIGVLTLLGVLAISPITNKADATNGWDEELKNYRESASTVALSMDSGTNSVVNAGNTNTNVGVVKRTASVTLGNTNGYSVYIRANSANLTGSNSSNTIPSVTGNSTLSQMTDKWGWNGSVGDNVTDCSLSDVFKQMTTTNQTLGSGGAVSSGTKKVTMCFGTRVSEAKVADTYSNTVTLSVVAEPGRTAAFGGITNMQQMTASICSAAPYHETAQLTDTRDGKKYWVTKMLDGNCWMSQNLDLDLGSNVVATYEDNGNTFTWNNSYPTTTDISAGSSSDFSTYSWDPKEYVINAPQATTSCGNTTSLNDCSMYSNVATSDGWVPSDDPNFYKNNENSPVNAATKTYDAHYLVGNYYAWNAATAGTGGTIVSANATGSICPSGWKLPNGENTTNNGTFGLLLTQYGVGSQVTGDSPINGSRYGIALSPLSFVRGGLVNGGTVRGAGNSGDYWTSRAGAYSTYYPSNNMSFTTGVFKLSTGSPRSLGKSLRCLVQTP